LLTNANSNAFADDDDIENEDPCVSISFNSKAIAEHLTMATKVANFFWKTIHHPSLDKNSIGNLHKL
jgi:hypothetical protein